MANTVTKTAAGTGLAVVDTTTGFSHQVPGVVLIDPATGNAYSATDTTEATQLAVKVAVQSIDNKTPPLVNGRIPVDGSGVTQPVSAVTRACVGRQTIPLAANTVTALTVPGGSVAAAIQADGNTVRVTLDGVTAPSATVGTRIDDGVIYYVDTALASVKVFAAVACAVQVAYFDKA